MPLRPNPRKLGLFSFMNTQERYLHFESLDMMQHEILSECSRCGQTFYALPQPGEHIDNLLTRGRFEYEANVCVEVDNAPPGTCKPPREC